jgi:hypothetical protein
MQTPVGRCRVGGYAGVSSEIGQFSAPGRQGRQGSPMVNQEENSMIKFGSFSLGDVFEREIRKLGEFAFRGKHSKGEASRRFVEEFVKAKQSRCVDDEHGETQGLEEGKNPNYKGGKEKMQECIRPSPESPVKPKYPHGTCIEHLYSHSWSNPGGVWIWVKKGEALAVADLGLGFPARREEVRRFGSGSRRVTRTTSKKVDGRSFVEVATMDIGRGRGQMRRGGMGSRPADRAGLGRFPEDRGADEFDGNLWNRERGPNDLERDKFRGNFGGQSSGSQGGFREEKGRFDQQRVNNNKRQFEEGEDGVGGEGSES